MISHESESCSVLSGFLQPHGLYSPWNSPGQSTRVGSLSFTPRDLPKLGIEPKSPALQVDSLSAKPQGKAMILHIMHIKHLNSKDCNWILRCNLATVLWYVLVGHLYNFFGKFLFKIFAHFNWVSCFLIVDL